MSPPGKPRPSGGAFLVHRFDRPPLQLRANLQSGPSDVAAVPTKGPKKQSGAALWSPRHNIGLVQLP